MSLPRLTFLYPTFFSTAARGQALCGTTCCKHAVRSSRQAGNYPRRRQRCSFSSLSRTSGFLSSAAGQRRCLGTLQESTPRRDDSVIALSAPSPPSGKKVSPNKNKSGKISEGVGAVPGAKAEEKLQDNEKEAATKTDKSKAETTDIGKNYVPESLKDTSALDIVTAVIEPGDAKKDSTDKETGPSSGSGGRPNTIPSKTPTEIIMSPTLAKLYHNFDTYAMVKQLEAGGFTYGQSAVAMKAIRGLLSLNLEKAKDSMVTKSMSENENYLFRAACSELKTETEFGRRTALEKTRIDRAQIQHDYEQLEQKLNEDLMNLKDEVSSLFNDRKIVTRQEQRAMEVKIQELNYKLTILLNGDMRSEIEALRWTTTRRGLIAIAMIAVVVVTLIRYSSIQSHAIKKEALQEAKDPLHHAADAGLVATLSSSASRDRPDGKDNGDGGTFVSLG